jgi:hypothetical protein
MRSFIGWRESYDRSIQESLEDPQPGETLHDVGVNGETIEIVSVDPDKISFHQIHPDPEKRYSKTGEVKVLNHVEPALWQQMIQGGAQLNLDLASKKHESMDAMGNEIRLGDYVTIIETGVGGNVVKATPDVGNFGTFEVETFDGDTVTVGSDGIELVQSAEGGDAMAMGGHEEDAPAGFKGTVKAMKDEPEIDNPYALAHWMKGKGMKSHKKADGSDKESVKHEQVAPAEVDQALTAAGFTFDSVSEIIDTGEAVDLYTGTIRSGAGYDLPVFVSVKSTGEWEAEDMEGSYSHMGDARTIGDITSKAKGEAKMKREDQGTGGVGVYDVDVKLPDGSVKTYKGITAVSASQAEMLAIIQAQKEIELVGDSDATAQPPSLDDTKLSEMANVKREDYCPEGTVYDDETDDCIPIAEAEAKAEAAKQMPPLKGKVGEPEDVEPSGDLGGLLMGLDDDGLLPPDDSDELKLPEEEKVREQAEMDLVYGIDTEHPDFPIGKEVSTGDGPGKVVAVTDNMGETLIWVELTGLDSYPGPFEYFPQDLGGAYEAAPFPGAAEPFDQDADNDGKTDEGPDDAQPAKDDEKEEAATPEDQEKGFDDVTDDMFESKQFTELTTLDEVADSKPELAGQIMPLLNVGFGDPVPTGWKLKDQVSGEEKEITDVDEKFAIFADGEKEAWGDALMYSGQFVLVSPEGDELNFSESKKRTEQEGQFAVRAFRGAGSVLGAAETWLKSNGVLMTFDSMEEAQAHADKLMKGLVTQNVSYQAMPYDPSMSEAQKQEMPYPADDYPEKDPEEPVEKEEQEMPIDYSAFDVTFQVGEGQSQQAIDVLKTKGWEARQGEAPNQVFITATTEKQDELGESVMDFEEELVKAMESAGIQVVDVLI